MAQHSTVNGHGNIVVQAVGDGITVMVGYPHLSLTRFEAEQHHDITHGRILLPESRAIPVVGRDLEMAELLKFVNADVPADARARVLVGGGGSGKTRLALKLCDEIKGTWNAGFVTTTELDRFSKQQNARDWGWQKPTLIVVDYANAHASVLADWLRELVDRPSPRYPLRILLLDRHADPASGWHKAVFNPGGGRSLTTSALLDPPDPVRIRPLTEPVDRLTVVRSVIEKVAPQLLDKLTNEPSLLTQLEESRWAGDPLYLAMAALTMTRSGDTSALKLGRTDLALQVAGHERNRLCMMAEDRGLKPALVNHLYASITLMQGLALDEAIDLIRKESQAAGYDQANTPAELKKVLHEASPDFLDKSHIAALQPDLIGEAFLLLAWSDVEDGKSALTRLFNEKPQTVLETLVRVMQDFDATDARPREWFSSLIRKNWENREALQAIDSQVPSVSFALTEVNVTLAQRLLELERVDGACKPESIAARLIAVAIAQARAGQREAATSAAQEAVSLYRDLARQQSDDFTSHLAGALNNLAAFWGALGKREAALCAAQEAASLYRDLARQRPDAFTPDLATALNNLATVLSALGQREAALSAAQEAASLCRELARLRPDAFTPNLAAALNNLANRLSELGLREAALSAAQETASLCRELARLRPDAFTPNLATALNNLANRLSELGLREAALSAAQEAASLYRDLARQRPDAFTPDLATALNNLANFLSALGQREGAVSAAKEAVSVRRELARLRPETFTPDLATALNNLAATLSELGQREAALSAAQEAVSLYRDLARLRCDPFTPDLAMALNNLAVLLSAQGLREAALSAAQEASSLYRELARLRPEVFTPDLAMALNNLARRLSELGQREAALSAAQEATSLYRDLARVRPDAFAPNLATSLIVLAIQTEATVGTNAAVIYALEAASTLSPAFLIRPQVHARLMAGIIKNYVRLCEASKIDPDIEFLSPLIAFFERESKE